MNRKIFNVAVSFALMFSMLGAVACTTAVDQSEKIEYTLDGADNLTSSFGEPYSAPQYKFCATARIPDIRRNFNRSQTPTEKPLPSLIALSPSDK